MLPLTSVAQTTSPVLTHGHIDLTQQGNELNINQTTQNAIANWQSFSIGADEVVNVQQLNADSALLNRVLGADPSKLLGQLNANGQVYLINPNGVLVGEGAQINAAEFIASTLDVSDADFLNGGDLLFSGDSTANVLNLGSITSSSGDVVLIASSVINDGELSAPEGLVALGAGNEILLATEQNQRLIVRSALANNMSETGIDNSGLIEAAEAALVAAGGDIYDLAINQTGIIKATGIENKAGRILLTADGGDIQFSGSASAQNLDGSGGQVNIGGGLRGADDSIANAANTVVTDSAAIDVSSSTGDAGQVVVWAEGHTEFSGFIDGTASGLDGGEGAFVEVSGKEQLSFTGFVDLHSESDLVGTLLLDPDNLTVQAADPGANILLVSDLETQLAAGNVVLDTGAFASFDPNANGTITINDDVIWTSDNSLSLLTSNSININAGLSGGAADIDLGLGFIDEFAFGGPTPTAALTVDSSASITANSLTVRRNPAAVIAASNSLDGFIGSIIINGMLDLGTLDIQPSANTGFSPAGFGVQGDVIVDNAGNQIDNFTNGGAGSTIGGVLTLVDSSGGLNVSGSFESAGTATISTVGDLSLMAGTVITTNMDTAADISLAAQNGSFVNNAGVIGVSPGGEGRFLIYSDNPADTNLGGLITAPVYNRTFAANAPATVTEAGDRVLYSLAPTLVLTANDNQRQEGEANPALTFSISGLVGGDVASEVFSGTPTLSTAAIASSPIDDYAIDIANGTVVLSDYGYALSLAPGTLSVVADPTRLLTVTANDASRIFGDENPAFTADIAGFRVGDDASLVSGLQFTTTATLQSSVGTYTITPFGASAEDYNFAYVDGTLTIDLRDLTITADSAERIFGDTLPEPLSFTTSGLASFDTRESLGAVTISGGAMGSLFSVGSHAVIASGATNPNYNITYVNGSVEVTPAPLTLSASSATRTFGAANPRFTVSTSGLVTGTSLDLSTLTITTVGTDSPIGVYSVTPGGVTDSNYDISFAPGSLTITPAQLTISVNDVSRDYGSANPLFTFTNSELFAGDTLSDVVTDINVTSSATQNSNVGRRSIDFTATQISDNYNLTINNGILDINRVDVDLFLDPVSRLYGESENPSPNIVAFGLVNGDTTSVFSSVSVNYFASPSSDVGTYTAQFFSANAQNYNIRSLNNGILNILPRDLTITPNNATREFGDENPAFTATFDGLASFDDASDIVGLTFTSAPPDANPLDYAINVSTGSNPNYNITTEQGLLTVTPAPVSILIDDFERLFFDNIEIPETTAFVSSGLKLDDTFRDLGFEFSTDATLLSDVGEYRIGGTINNLNYDLQILREGTLTVNPVLLTANFRGATQIYGEPLSTDFDDYFLSASGIRFGSASDILSISVPDVQSDVGIYDLGVNLTSDNYILAATLGGQINIVERRIAIMPENIIRTFGEAEPDPSYLIAGDGLASFDTLEDVIFPNNILIDGEFIGLGSRSDVGQRTTLAALTENPNYIVTNREGLHVILPRPIEITVDDADAVGNFPLPNFSANATNLLPGDSLEALFPDARFQLSREDDPAPIQLGISDPDDFIIPNRFREDEFFESFPSRIIEPEAEFDEGSFVGEFEPIEVTTTDDSDSSGVIVLSDSILISSTLFSAAEQEAEEPVTQHIQFTGFRANPNYIVTSNTNGLLTWEPDPAIAAQRREIEAEQAIYTAAYDSVFNPPEGAGNLLGVPEGAEEVLFAAIGNRLLNEEDGELAAAISRYGDLAQGTTSEFEHLTGGAFSNFDTLAFLQAARTDPEAGALLGEIYSSYLVELIQVDTADMSDAQFQVVQALSGHAEDARDSIASGMEAKFNAWSDTAEATTAGMSNLFGGVDPPWDEFLGEAAGDFAADSLAATAVAGGAGLAGTAAIGGVMLGATGAILPFATSTTVAGVTTLGGSIAGTGASVASGTVAAVAAPVAIVGVAIAGSIARGVQVFENVAQQEIYDDIQDSVGQPVDLQSLSMTDDEGETNPLDSAILLGAIAAMLAG